MSRFLLGIVVLIFLPTAFILEIYGIKTVSWGSLATVVGILAGVYGLNSAAGAWKREESSTTQTVEKPSGGAVG